MKSKDHHAKVSFDDHHANPLRMLLSHLNPYSKYVDDPVGFARDILGITLWSKQAEILEALVQHRRVLVKSSNSVGKTLLCAVAAEWFHCVFEQGECVVTCPREEQLTDTIFKELRQLHGNRPGFFPRSNRIETDPKHYVKGTCAKDATAFQGIHAQNIFLIFEECTGVEAQFWEGARGILAGGENTYWLVVCNPTDNSSQAFLEEQSGQWEVFSISAFDHPNIINELKGEPAVIPSAIRLKALKSNMEEWGTWISEADATPSDIKFEEIGQPTRWWKPGPIGEARILGRYPSQAAYSIFGESDFVIASSFHFEADEFFKDLERRVKEGGPKAGMPDRFGPNMVPQFGCDVARFGDNRTEIHGRIGKYSFLHEFHNGQDTEWTANRLKQLCNEWGKRLGIAPTKIPSKIDDTGVGGGVVDQRGDFHFVPINAAWEAIEHLGYPNKRSEMLFNLCQMMRAGDVRFCPWIEKRTIQELKQQALSVTYKPDARGRRVAEPKEKIKDRLKGRSPDGLDAMGLAYYSIGDGWTEHISVNVESKGLDRFTNPTNHNGRPLQRDNHRDLFGVR